MFSLKSLADTHVSLAWVVTQATWGNAQHLQGDTVLRF